MTRALFCFPPFLPLTLLLQPQIKQQVDRELKMEASSKNARVYARVEKYAVNGGLDLKFDKETFPPGLKGIITYKEFVEVIDALNACLERHRSTALDHGLLVASVVC